MLRRCINFSPSHSLKSGAHTTRLRTASNLQGTSIASESFHLRLNYVCNSERMRYQWRGRKMWAVILHAGGLWGCVLPSEMMCQPLAVTLHRTSSKSSKDWLLTVVIGGINNHFYICTVNFHLRKRLLDKILLVLVFYWPSAKPYGFKTPQREK